MRTLMVVTMLLGAELIISGCGTPTAKCSASSCSGCCDAMGQCQIGASNAACGSGGASCQPCANSQACTIGQCVVQNTSGGGNGGGTGGGTVTGGGAGGGSGGSGGGVTGGGTGGGTSTTCSASNCDGCCASNGVCFGGVTQGACGLRGAACAQCGNTQACSNGSCVNGTGGGGGSSCSSATCPAGCCTAAGMCINTSTPARCGAGGNACQSCQMGNTCVSGNCQTCTGCIDINTGACVAGNLNTKCGRSGGFCQTCDSAAGQTCQSGFCTGGTTCNGSTCTGCCDGNNCVQPSQFTNAQCGQANAGAACVPCLGASSCAFGICSDPGTGGGGGGVGFDGGFFDLCTLAGTPCTSTQCCDVDSLFLFIPTCYSVGQSCGNAGICRAGNVCQ